MTDYRKLGLQESDFDNTFAEHAEAVAMPRKQELNLLFIAACVIMPFGLPVLVGALLRRFLKEKQWQSRSKLLSR